MESYKYVKKIMIKICNILWGIHHPSPHPPDLYYKTSSSFLSIISLQRWRIFWQEIVLALQSWEVRLFNSDCSSTLSKWCEFFCFTTLNLKEFSSIPSNQHPSLQQKTICFLQREKWKCWFTRSSCRISLCFASFLPFPNL